MVTASTLKVMIVDDQASMRALMRHTLQDIGVVNIRDKASAAEALEDVRADRVHLIVSDYAMPDMDGLAFLRAVRADAAIQRTAFIMLTGSSDRKVVEQAAALGVNNYLVKPFSSASLREKIERVFGALA